MRAYTKFIGQVLATGLAALIPSLTDNVVSASEWVNVGILTLGSVGVLGAGNLPAGVWKYTKTYVSAATAGLVVLASFLTDGVSLTEWLQVVIAVLGSLGVFGVPGPKVYPTPRGRHEAA